ncbi:hypothetical protein [Microbacterium sp. E-13]|uniref:hypothetical protein n=1 Tax=Microbacterium sp. E-13 TaxID=3404048 RepID=UPI003CE9F62F
MTDPRPAGQHLAAAALTSLSVSAWLTAVGLIEVQRDAIEGGFLVDLQGQPTAAIIPRTAWELQALQVMIAAVAVWLLGRYLFRQPSAIRRSALMATALVLCAVMLAAGLAGYGLGSEEDRVGFLEEWIYRGFTSTLGIGLLGFTLVTAAVSWREARIARDSTT